MKRFFLTVVLITSLFFIYQDADAQRGRGYYRSYPTYRYRPMISISVGTGFYDSRIWSSAWGPRVGFNIGIVVPPPGSKVRNLPSGTTEIEINGITYYRHNNVYFRERKDGGFETVSPPIGARLSRLPMGAKLKKIDGNYYYEMEGTIYYKWDENGRSSYEIVGKHGVLDTEEIPYSEEYNELPEESRSYNEEKKEAVISGSNAENDQVYIVRPQLGDQFDRLPRGSKEIYVNGEKQYVSLNNIYYKEVMVDGKIFYEVVKVK